MVSEIKLYETIEYQAEEASFFDNYSKNAIHFSSTCRTRIR